MYDSDVSPQQNNLADLNKLKEDNSSVTIPRIEEYVIVDKKVVETAKVTIAKTVHEEVEQVAVPLAEEHVIIERIPKNQFIVEAPPVRYEGDIMVLSVVKEVATIEKRLMLVEEIHVSKKMVEKIETVPVTLRKETIDITRIDTNSL